MSSSFRVASEGKSSQASGNAATHVPLTRDFARFTPKESLITVYTIYQVWRHVTMVALFLADNETDGDGKKNGKNITFILTNNNFARASRY